MVELDDLEVAVDPADPNASPPNVYGVSPLSAYLDAVKEAAQREVPSISREELTELNEAAHQRWTELAEERERRRWIGWRRDFLRELPTGLPAADIEAISTRQRAKSEATIAVARWMRRWSAESSAPPAERCAPVFLVLMGPPGRGKSFAAADWLERVTRAGTKSSHAWVTERELCDLETARFGKEREQYQRILSRGALVVDELGRVDRDDGARRVLFDVLERRKGGARLTILITNLRHSEFERRRLESTIRSRLEAHAELAIITGPDLRPKPGFWPSAPAEEHSR